MSNLVINQLKNGILPPELNFSANQNQQIDWEKVRYNAFYKSPDFFESKFPVGFNKLPGFDKIIESMIANSKTPLEEIEDLQIKISK